MPAPSRVLPLAALAALLATGCILPKSHPYELDEAHIGAPGVEQVGLLPLNTLRPLPPELDGASDRVLGIVREHLGASGVQVVEFQLGEARELWNRAAGDASPDAEAEASRSDFVRLLHRHRPFDVLVEPSLVYRDARIRAVTRAVEWDGVERELQVSRDVNQHGSVHTMMEIRGKMPGVSLHLAAYLPEGERVFDSYAGLDLVHEAEVEMTYARDLTQRPPLPTWRWRLARRRLGDEAHLREGVALAFSPWLAPPAASAAAPGGAR